MPARQLIRTVATAAIALLGCVGGAWAQNTQVNLVANTCYKVGDTVTVKITKGTSPSGVIAAQFFLAFDTSKLQYLGGDPGDPATSSPFTFEIVDTAPATANAGGTIDYVVGLPLGNTNGPTAPATFGRLRFTATHEICAGANLLTFRANTPSNALVNASSATVPADFNDLGAVTIDSTPPTIACGAGQMDIADAGTCTHTFTSIPAPTVGDNCGGTPSVSFVRSDGQTNLLAPYPVGDTTITWTATDCSGNVNTCQQHVVVQGLSTMNVTVELANVSAGPFTRCIAFQFFKSASCPTVLGTASGTFTFVNGVGSGTIQVPCGPGFDCATARDPLHTLRRTADPGHFMISGSSYIANFTGTDALIGGNLNDDDFIDILDYGAFVGQFGHTYPAGGTTCSSTPINADINGDNVVDVFDYTYIGGLNFGLAREPNCCGAPLAAAPVMDISVWDLVARGEYEMARTADLNHDGRLNIEDVNWLGQHGLPRCLADFDDDQVVTVQDIFAYISAWFSSYPAADTNDDHVVDVADMFGYLGVWFNGCP